MLKHFRSTQQHHLDHLRVGLARLLGDRSGVDVERRSDVRVQQSFLRHLQVRSHCQQVRRQRMMNVVPADQLSHNGRTLERGTDVPLEQVVGTHRLFALEPDRVLPRHLRLGRHPKCLALRMRRNLRLRIGPPLIQPPIAPRAYYLL